MEKDLGTEKTNKLMRYAGVTALSRPQAMEIMETIWPDAPVADKVAAAILCSSYGLNPLANHVFLIKFHDKKKNKDEWVRVWGIKAKRLLASRRGGYSYLDMTPRLMTAEEQIKVWGKVDIENLCYMTWLRDMLTGAEVYGYGKWPLKAKEWDYDQKKYIEKDNEPYGTDKGNSIANMASIRSESQALDRLRPAEMPVGFAIADEQYIEGKSRIVDAVTGEIADTPAKEENAPQVHDEIEEKAETGDTEVDDIVQRLNDCRWTVATLRTWLAGPPLKVASPGVGTVRELVAPLDRSQRLALCKKLSELP